VRRSVFDRPMLAAAALRNPVLAPRLLLLGGSSIAADLRHQLPSAKVPRRPRSPSKATMQSPSALSERERWTTVWDSEERPRFDASASSPALLRLLEEDQTVRKALSAGSGARVLVPGCGRGYDLAAFARAAVAATAAAAAGSSSSPSPSSSSSSSPPPASVSVVGWDYVPEAVRSAKDWLESPASGLAELRERSRSIAVEVEEADFFERASSSLSPSSPPPFTLAFDYTFFCALPPSQREEWARAYARLLAQGSGLLVTLIFPAVPPPGLGVERLPEEERAAFRASFGSAGLVAAAASAGGPPWPVSPEEYKRVLLSEEALFELVSCEPVPARLSHRGRGGREYLAVWRRTNAPAATKGEKLSSL
jgi:SAM-dependent methyltransferase